MAEERTHRRLAAILAADVVGYSRMMELDEVGTLTALKARRKDVLAPLIVKHEGRIFKVTGDGVFIEFASAVNAVQCSIDLQQGMAASNGDLPDDRRIVLRVGVNLGDVIVEGTDLYGDGVNIAARLETIAEPGGICVSEDALRQVRNRLSIAVDDLGAQTLKNIAEPIRVYRIAGTPAPEAATTMAVANKPSIAILPFANMSSDPDQEYLSDGITEDIITELSRFRSLFVIARNSSFQYRGRNVDLRRVGRELGAQFIIEGSIRKSSNHVRVTAQLINTSSGNHVWAERYDREMYDIFLLQDELAHAVAATVSNRIEAVGRERTARLSPAGLSAHDLILRGNASRLKFTKSDNDEARGLFQKAIEVDPTNARAHAYCAHTYFMSYISDWAPDRDQTLKTALDFAKRAVSLDEGDATARWVLGLVYLFLRSFGEARIHFEKSLQINPNDASANGHYGLFLSCVGEAAKAIEVYEIARRRDPLDPSWVPWLKGIACFTARRYEEAIAALSGIHEPINEVRLWLAASLAQSGRLDDARTTLEQFIRVAKTDMEHFPGCRLGDWNRHLHGVIEYENQEDMDHLMAALRLAGFSD